MAKQTGLGGGLWVDEFNLSNDTQSMTANGGPALLDVTGIDSSGVERLGGKRDGNLGGTFYFNDATGKAHTVLKALPTTDTIVTYMQGTTLGDAACSLTAKQLNFDGTRGEDGSLVFDMQAASSDLGLVWGKMGTAGLLDDTGTTNEASIDNLAASTAGLRAFLHVTEFTGTNATIQVQESSDDGSGDAFGSIAAFTTVTGVGAEAIAVTGAIERYLRVSISAVTALTSITWGVMVARL